MKKIAVLLTVFNRCEVTLAGLSSLYKAISYLPNNYKFDIFMTDDGCTDGTVEAVKKEFPYINIVKGGGNLYWSGGMRFAWDFAARKSDYDYYLWFNDDAFLNKNALDIMLKSVIANSDNCVISGAFCDDKGYPSYGGKTRDWKIIAPQKNQYREIYWMNGNLVIIPNKIFKKVGNIDGLYIHDGGDYDYGRRVFKYGFKVLLTDEYVGMTNRHDNPYLPPFNPQNNFLKRINLLYSPRFTPLISFRFNLRHIGFFAAIANFLAINIKCVFPSIGKHISSIGHLKRQLLKR